MPFRKLNSLSMEDSKDVCLVRLVYLIHEPNWTSYKPFSFNPNQYYVLLFSIQQCLEPQTGNSKTDTYSCGSPVFRGYFFVLQLSSSL